MCEMMTRYGKNLVRIYLRKESADNYSSPVYVGFVVDEDEEKIRIKHFKYSNVGKSIHFGGERPLRKVDIREIMVIDREVSHN